MSGLGTLHHDTYFERMRSGLGDKARILDWLVPGSVLDVGAGDGSLVTAIQDAGWDAVGLDASPAAVRRSNGQVILGRAESIGDVFAETHTFDNIVFCSVLHEVWSYSEPNLRTATWGKAMAAASVLLKPGGRIVVRDGVGPLNPDRWWKLTPHDVSDAAAFLERWSQMQQPLLGHIDLELVDGALAGPAWQLAEFLMTYGWGWESLPREGNEFYTYAGELHSYSERLQQVTGLTLIHAEQWLQDGYCQAFERAGTLFESTEGDWRPIGWPASNALWVLEKPDLVGLGVE